MSAPLAGLRAVEMTEALAGPYCGMMLGDLGADVVKVERPGVGDQARRWGPPFRDGESAYFLSVNRNKRSVEADVKEPAGRELLDRLVAAADVFVVNNPRLESLGRLSLDPETVRGRHPRLVYAAVSGYGHSGPKAGLGGYDLVAQAESGTMALAGRPGDGPMRFPTAMADITAGVYATIGILAALVRRQRGGAGDFIDVALLDSQLTWLSHIAGAFFMTGEAPAKMGNAHPNIAPYQPLAAADQMLIVAVGNDRLWERFCAVLDVEETLMRDPRFANNPKRNRHRGELVVALEEILGRRPAAAWVAELTAAGVPAGPIFFPDEALAQEQVRAREMIVELEHPLLGLVRSIGNPVRMAAGGPTYRRYPPRLGEHTAEVRAELGL